MSFLSETREILRRYSLKPEKKMGQNFLVNERIIEMEAREAQLNSRDVVLEVGPGIGTLTQELLKKAGRVVAVEKSGAMVDILRDRFGDDEKLHLIHGDFTKVELPHFDKVISNIPYSISSSFIFKILSLDFEKAVVILQYEFARRLFAKPGTGDYSRISAAFSFLATGKIISKVSPSAFYPPPRVYSAVVEIYPKEKPLNKDNYLRILNLIFPYRRKRLKKALKLGAEREGIEINLDNIPDASAEKRVFQLTPEEIAEFTEMLGV